MTSGAACLGMAAATAASASSAAELIPAVKPKIRLVFTHPDPERQGWPSQHYDYESRKKMLLAKLRTGCPGSEFLPVTVKTEEEAKQVMAADAEVDGYILYMLGIPSAGNEVFALSGRPTAIVDDLYGGTGRFLGTYPRALREGKPVVGVSSTSDADLFEAVHAFETIRMLRASKILDVTERDLSAIVPAFKDTLGVTIQTVSADELNNAWKSAGAGEADQWARQWISNAEKVVEPSEAEIRKSAAMYVGMRGLLATHQAQAITVDCLRLFYGDKMFAYPCLGFFQLNNDGLVGACEADLDSTATMLLMTYLTGRPGYISDPVIDTSKNQIIYAHCVAATKVHGPGGKANPYHIRSHAEDHKGAAIRSLMPLGETVTTLKYLPARKQVVMHLATTVENIDEERACRTKLAATVSNARKLMAEWEHGWHRVTVYGDFKTPVETVSSLLGFEVLHEG